METRPWGSYIVLEKGRSYKVKRLTVKPGNKISLQMHELRNEHWIVVEGKALVTLDDKKTSLDVGDVESIPARAKHRLENLSDRNLLEVIEVQIGEYLGEDDIVRFEDDFGRN